MKPRRGSKEQGAVIIQVAIALLALTAISAIVVDYGILWTSRGHAQNSADAGALGAAWHMVKTPTDDAGTILQGRALAAQNAVWGESPAAADVLVQPRINCPPGTSEAVGGCVRVDVLRGATDRNGTYHANTLPTFFAQLLGLTSQGINATATAEVTSGNSITCIKPWILPDRWIESTGTWDVEDSFNPNVGDTYTNPGFAYPRDKGVELILKGDANEWSAGWVQELEEISQNCSRAHGALSGPVAQRGRAEQLELHANRPPSAVGVFGLSAHYL